MSDENHEIEIESPIETMGEPKDLLAVLFDDVNDDDIQCCAALSPQFIAMDSATQQRLLTGWIEFLEVIKIYVASLAEPEAEESLH